MEDLFPVVIIIIGVISSILSSAKKERAKRAAEELRQVAAAEQARAEQYQAAASASAPMAKPIAMSFGDLPEPAVTPTVHPHIQPDCDVHDAPGSLGGFSLEGKDPCHEDTFNFERTEQESAAASPGLTLEWTGENMVKAFVMQEILTRPGQRRA